MNTNQNERRSTVLWAIAGLAIIGAVFAVNLAIFPSGRMPCSRALLSLSVPP